MVAPGSSRASRRPPVRTGASLGSMAPASATASHYEWFVFRFAAYRKFINLFLSSPAPLFTLIFAPLCYTHGFLVANTLFLLYLLDEGHPGS